MEITVKRKEFTEESTIGEILVDGVFFSYCIEDKDRNLTSAMTAAEIAKIKVHGKTAIPYGRYKVTVSFSNRFQKLLPELAAVPGFAGIRIHPGNTAADSEGCILPGATKTKDFVGNSVKTFNALFKKIQDAAKKEKVFVTVTK